MHIQSEATKQRNMFLDGVNHSNTIQHDWILQPAAWQKPTLQYKKHALNHPNINYMLEYVNMFEYLF